MKTRRLLLSMVALGLLTTARDAHAELVFVSVQGQVTSNFSDWFNPFEDVEGVSVAGFGLVDDVAWNVVSPRDAASGLPTGRRLHKPVSLRLRRSAATLTLANSLTANETLTSVRVKWFERDASTGLYAPSQELVLTNASMASISMYTLREQGELVTYVDVTLTYQTIGIEDHATGVSYLDNWESTSP